MYQTNAVQCVSGEISLKNNVLENRTDESYATVYALAASAVPAAIAWFYSSNYLLSAELLTHAWIENFSPGDYAPINGNRVIGSQVTYSFVHSSNTNGGATYPIYNPSVYNTATCYEEDLGFALHGVNFLRSNVESTNIKITDRYDFATGGNVNDVLDALVAIFEIAQNYEIIGNYNVVIDIDVSDALYLELNSTVNNTHFIKVYNLSNNKIDVVYNTKMCLSIHATAFQNITDIDFITIPAKGNETVEIDTNGTASHITFCYIKDGYRVVTYADELYQDRSILNTTFEKSSVPANDIAIITKVNTNWLIKFTNNYGVPIRVDYNSKMCNQVSAESWVALTDIETFNLAPNEVRFVYIVGKSVSDLFCCKICKF